MARSEEEDDTAAVNAAHAERASSVMRKLRKWDLPPRLLCVYHYSNGSASKADGADVTYSDPHPSSKATPLLMVLKEQQLARLLHFLNIIHPSRKSYSLRPGSCARTRNCPT